MERPIFKPVGSKVEELDTPAFLVDIDALKHNLETVHSFFKTSEAKLRPHIDSHRCPAIAHRQLAAGGTVGGVSVSTVGEAEVFAGNGFTDIFVASEIVTPQKIARLCGLAGNVKITLAADSADNVKSLSEAASNAGVTLNVVVDIHTRIQRCGVEPGQPAVDLASVISKASNLNFAGIMSYEGTILADSADDLAKESKKYIQQVLDTREKIEKAGMEVGVVSVGGTHNYEIAGAMSGVTEVPAGSYALMDYRYSQHRPQLRTAAKVAASVISRPEPGLALMDTGQKAMGVDLGFPVAEDLPGTTVPSMSAEHGFLRGNVDGVVDLGEKVYLTPWEVGTTVNLYDYIHAVENGKLQAVWDVSARGRYR
jgi:D-serine deaminase-like pyridoxal phosphate-dependent protein